MKNAIIIPNYLKEKSLEFAGLAKDLLTSGSANVSEAAFASGFNDIYYFSAMFKKVTGENPSKYNK